MVISWLGEASDGSDEAIKLIRELGIFAIENEDDLEFSAESVERLGFPMQTQNWPALWKFFWRGYWTRVWIIQEMAIRGVLKDSSGVILCGSASVPRVYFDMGCTLILSLVLNPGNAFRDDYWQSTEPLRSMLKLGHPPVLSMVQVLAACNIGPQAKKLTHLLFTTSTFHASDPRDKIYALVGLCNEADRAFPVDYTKDYVDVLKDVVMFLVDKDKKLTVLHGNHYRPNSSGPSWVPQLDDERHLRSEIGWSAGTTKAAGDTEAYFEFISHGEILATRGVAVGELKDVIGPSPVVTRTGAESDLLSLAIASGIIDVLKQLIGLYRVFSEADREVMWRTLITDCDTSGGKNVYPAPEEFGAMFRVFAGIELPPESFSPDLPELQRRQQFASPFLRKFTYVFLRILFLHHDLRAHGYWSILH